jgi:hypothetical protein
MVLMLLYVQWIIRPRRHNLPGYIPPPSPGGAFVFLTDIKFATSQDHERRNDRIWNVAATSTMLGLMIVFLATLCIRIYVREWFRIKSKNNSFLL